ncbi:MAG: DEAD/DEAH box helicase, partial [Acidobacteriota bacterium]|nr:DEAD/DEAH box helicase [Acidobacteriota bacterium]
MPSHATLAAHEPARSAWPQAARRGEPAPPGPPPAFASRRAVGRDELLAARCAYPRPSRLARPLAVEGARAREALRGMGVETVGDLLMHLPHDVRVMRPLAELRPGDQATVAVEVRSISARPVIRRARRAPRSLVEAKVSDASGSLVAAFFNQPWLARRYEPGARLLLHGKLDARRRLQVWSHAPEGLGAVAPDGGAVSHYPASGGVSSTQIASLLRAARCELTDVGDPLPARMRAAEELPDRASALAALHFPRGGRDEREARRRLAFDELLMDQLAFLVRRRRREAAGEAVPLAARGALAARWLERSLPFALTADQSTAMGEIDADLARTRPMQRLLIGEVGSGKTVVALYAMLRAVEQGHQAALMAPTETLAEQHLGTVRNLLAGEEVPVALLTGSTPARARCAILASLESGAAGLAIGTHALIEPDVRFRSLAVAVIDEQHRFGVRQRVALEERGGGSPRPHLLHLTATPIPRTLALARYGDLDVSTLRGLPAGREPVGTEVVAAPDARARAYARLRRELVAGRQGYVVCPLVNEPQEGDGEGRGAEEDGRHVSAGPPPARAATAELERLASGELSGFRL